ncbi:MAG: radical SAM/SPASM domain-containing protein [Candidatus Xenobia bacterium]
MDPRLEGIATGRVLTGPETIHIDVTNSCNTNCVTCWDHSPLLREARPAAWKRQRVEADAVQALLDDVAGLGGLRAVIVSGMGEPFTHPDIYRIIDTVKQRGLHLTIITNLVAADAARILELGVDQLLIGVQGATEAAYRAFHPSFRTDEWQTLLRMLETFAAAGKRYKHVQVISRETADDLVAMIDFAHRYRAAQVNFKLASLRDGTEGCRITEEQRQRLVDELIPAARERARALAVPTNLAVFARQVQVGGEATAPIEDVGCFMGWYYSRILVDGTVLYCCNTAVRVGRITETVRFSHLWNGPRWNALRDSLRRGEYLRGCHQCGKINQNVKIGERFAAQYGESRRLAVIGRHLDVASDVTVDEGASAR